MTEQRGSRGRPQPARGKQPKQPSKRARSNKQSRQSSRQEGGFGPYRRPEGETTARRRRDDATAEPPRRDARPTRPTLRVVGTRQARDTDAASKPRRPRATPATARPRRRRRGSPADVEEEIRRLAGRNADRALRRLMDAADAYAHDREREALRILRPLRDQLPDSPTVRELVGLSQYRLGNYRAATKELEAYANLSNAVDQNPVLMDCYRAQRRWQKVESAWEELAATSPSGELVAEGRIVYAGALADQGRLDEALAVLRKRADRVRDPKEHHLRLWYALGDLEERAGNLARARELFDRVRRVDPQYVDVSERRAALG
jgi:tetratricopeptide (TPR) repeat protein